MSLILFGATLAAVLSSAGQANAQFKVNEEDGIAASPKFRQMLNERKASQAAAVTAKHNSAATYVSHRAGGSDGIAASPRMRQMLEEKRASAHVAKSGNDGGRWVGYKPVGKDGIAASPKFRQQLDERGGAIIIAPVK